ncbi:MAG: endonuclease MutS2 [Armatimonadetes bacterium]|nr:endonuclease MutS2 [Armatimonadota bacterium]
MDAHTLKVLEFSDIICMLRERTACALGDDVARQLEPTNDFLAITEGQRETTEAKRILQEEGPLPLGGIHDIRPHVNKAAMDGVLGPSDLLEVAETLAAGRRLKGFIQKRQEMFPKLAEVAANIGVFPRIEEAVGECISESGEIRDTASPDLARIRSRLKAVHARLTDRLHSIIHSAEFRTMIQDPVIIQRGDRYCIPIKAEHRPHFPGIVHDSSASGATVFMEPASVVEMGNELKELALKEQHEIERILRRLSSMVKSSASEITVTLGALGRLDFISAKAKLSCDMNATEPLLNNEGRLDITKARHPLLKGEVVPIDVRLGEDFTALLITGPNTGGKTVALKTVGLLTLMAQSGLHIPANPGSELAVFDKVFADIGDEQSIQQSLSTFSSHMGNIVNIIRNLSQNSLVLLDEIGAGTDPAEGAALAKAILDNLMEKGVRVVATTHYGELKEFAFVRKGIENASVEFDIQTLQPTYRLMIGVPGSSNALAIASRLGLPPQIIQEAREMIGGRESSEEIIRKIEQTHRAAAEREQVAERISRDVEELKRRYEKRLEELEILRREIRQQLAEEIDRHVRKKIEELEQIIQDLKRIGSQPKKIDENRKKFKQRVKEIRDELEELLPEEKEEPEGPFVLKAGDQVRVTTFNVDGELLNDPGEGEALVMVGSMKVSVPFSVLRPAKSISKKIEKATGAVQISAEKVGQISPELKLIAQRVEQALINLDKYLDDAYLAGLASVRIIHGKGTGALRKAVWEFLANHHAVESFRLGEQDEGGTGATIVKLREK